MPFARREMSLISGSIDWYNVVVVAILLDVVASARFSFVAFRYIPPEMQNEKFRVAPFVSLNPK